MRSQLSGGRVPRGTRPGSRLPVDLRRCSGSPGHLISRGGRGPRGTRLGSRLPEPPAAPPALGVVSPACHCPSAPHRASHAAPGLLAGPLPGHAKARRLKLRAFPDPGAVPHPPPRSPWLCPRAFNRPCMGVAAAAAQAAQCMVSRCSPAKRCSPRLRCRPASASSQPLGSHGVQRSHTVTTASLGLSAAQIHASSWNARSWPSGEGTVAGRIQLTPWAADPFSRASWSGCASPCAFACREHL